MTFYGEKMKFNYKNFMRIKFGTIFFYRQYGIERWRFDTCDNSLLLFRDNVLILTLLHYILLRTEGVLILAAVHPFVRG
jgi:hypothetical protein